MKYKSLILVFFTTTFLNAEYTKLESTDGRKINVKILSIEDSSIRVERKDGYEFTIENALLSKASLDLIHPLRIKNEIEGNRSFDIGFTEKRTDKSSKTFDFHGLDISEYQKKISIRKPETLNIDGLELRYIILIKRDASEGLPAFIQGTEKIKESLRHSKLEYESPVYSLKRMYVLPNHWWDRDKKEYEDEEEGTWARLYYKDKLIYEECSPKRLSQKYSWDDIIKVSIDPFAPPSQVGKKRSDEAKETHPLTASGSDVIENEPKFKEPASGITKKEGDFELLTVGAFSVAARIQGRYRIYDNRVIIHIEEGRISKSQFGKGPRNVYEYYLGLNVVGDDNRPYSVSLSEPVEVDHTLLRGEHFEVASQMFDLKYDSSKHNDVSLYLEIRDRSGDAKMGVCYAHDDVYLISGESNGLYESVGGKLKRAAFE